MSRPGTVAVLVEGVVVEPGRTVRPSLPPPPTEADIRAVAERLRDLALAQLAVTIVTAPTPTRESKIHDSVRVSHGPLTLSLALYHLDRSVALSVTLPPPLFAERCRVAVRGKITWYANTPHRVVKLDGPAANPEQIRRALVRVVRWGLHEHRRARFAELLWLDVEVDLKGTPGPRRNDFVRRMARAAHRTGRGTCYDTVTIADVRAWWRWLDGWERRDGP